MIWGKYIEYTGVTEKILKNHANRVASIPGKTEQLAELTATLGEVNYPPGNTPVKTTLMTDRIPDYVIRKKFLEDEIREIKLEDKIFSEAWNRLTAEEKMILGEFYQSGQKSAVAAEKVASKLGYERTKVFQLRKQAVEKFKAFIL